MTLHLQHLAFQRNNVFLFDGLHLELQPGELLQVRGENGCGKSTLLRILAGYLRPETGTVLWRGKNIFQTLDDYSEAICFLGHQNGVKSHLTVYENLKLVSALSGVKCQRDSLKKILQVMGLSSVEKMQAMTLSAGQKRRLALSRFQLVLRRLWILDEPLTALDEAGHALFKNMLEKHLASGGMAVVATHHDLKINDTMKTLVLGGEEKKIHV